MSQRKKKVNTTQKWSSVATLPSEWIDVLEAQDLRPGPLAIQMLPTMIEGRNLTFTSVDDERLMFFTALSVVYSAFKRHHSLILVNTQADAYSLTQWVAKLCPTTYEKKPFTLSTLWLGFGQMLKTDEAHLDQHWKKKSPHHAPWISTPARLKRLWQRRGGKQRLKLHEVACLVFFDIKEQECKELSEIIFSKQTMVYRRGTKEKVELDKAFICEATKN